MNKIFYIIIVVLVIILAGALLFTFGTGQDVPSSEKSQTADARLLPDLTFSDYEGNEVTLHDFIGTPLVVNTWASWCPFCLHEMPDFAEAQKEFGDKVTIILINRAESLNTAKTYTDDLGVT